MTSVTMTTWTMTTTSDSNDPVIDKAWSNISPGDFVRWATPRFIKYGVVLHRKQNSLIFQCMQDDLPVTIPDAKWYFVQGKMYGPKVEECLVILDALPTTPPRAQLPRVDDDLIITVAQACELIQMDPKQFRRHIRRGTIPASKNGEGQWLLRRDLLMKACAKYGWI